MTPLVLLPGMGCSPDLWSGLDLSQGSAPPGDVDPVTPVLEEPDLDREVDRLLRVLPGRFALAGLSLGAIVAMALVRRAPGRVVRLALLSTNPYPPTEAQLAGWADQRRALAASGPRALQAGLLPSLLSPPVLTGRPEVVERTLTMAEDVGEVRYDAQLRLQATRVDERPGLPAVDCPTLVLAAREDRLCRVDRHEEIAALVPGAELVVLDDCAHLSPLEQPAALSRHLGRWLRRPVG